MAEGILRSMDHHLFVRSAGTDPSERVHPNAVRVMTELGIDISHGKPENVNRYLEENWDFVITVCDHARETCPVFPGNVEHRLHIGFPDPAEAEGSEAEVLEEFRRVRDEIRRKFRSFYQNRIGDKKADGENI